VSGLAVITGGAGHLGRAVARRLGADGMAVALWDRDAAALERAAGELSAAGLRCRTACVDLTDAAAVAAAASALSGAGEGPVRVLVAAAGWSPKRAGARPATVDISAEEWRAVLEVNLTAVFHAVAGLIPGMAAAGGGRIVAISSTAGVTGSATAGVHYCAAKAGVLGLVRALAAELAPQGILVNAVAPGKVHNPQWEDTPEAREAYARAVPLGRLATAEEIGEVIAFLASERNTYTTGATLVVDGGRLAR